LAGESVPCCVLLWLWLLSTRLMGLLWQLLGPMLLGLLGLLRLRRSRVQHCFALLQLAPVGSSCLLRC
jgi:hypothetical protein